MESYQIPYLIFLHRRFCGQAKQLRQFADHCNATDESGVIYRLPQGASTQRPSGRRFWWIVFTVMLIVLLMKYIFDSSVSPGDYIVSGIAGFLLGLLVSSMSYAPFFSLERLD